MDSTTTTRPTHMLHLGLTLTDGRETPLTADDLGPDFLTDGDSFDQWCEPFDGTQRVYVNLADLPDDPTDFADEAREALKALVALRELPADVAGSGSFTEADGGEAWSEWEVPVVFDAPTYRLPDPDAPCIGCGAMVMGEMACPDRKRECVDCCGCHPEP